MTAPNQHGPTVDELAAEYLRRVEEGEIPDLSTLGARLDSDAERDALCALVDEARHIQSLLPVQARPGTVLSGRYRLHAEIGAGGMGKVFEAEDLSLKRRVAVKVLAVFGMPSYDPHALLCQEAEILAGFQHPHIVAVHEIAREGDLHYLVMDLVRGLPLTRVLEGVREHLGQHELPRDGGLMLAAFGTAGTPLPRHPEGDSWFTVVARLLETLARTLAHAHGRGLVHRDIKPANVMLTADGSPVVLDFGLAGTREAAGSGVTAGLVGSAAYLAPEQAREEQVGKDPRTDVYQLGVLLYELLTLRPAYEESSVPALLQKVARGDALPPRRIDRGMPSELEAICLMAMEADPEHRYATATALADDLRRFLDGTELPRASGRAALSRRLRYAWRRQRHRVAAVGLVLLLVAVGFGTWWARGPRVTEVEPFLYRPDGDLRASLLDGTGDSVIGENIATVSPGDALGVLIDATGPTWVYALSVFGPDAQTPEWLAPMEVELLPGNPTAPPVEPGPPVGFAWGLQVPEGESKLVCTRISEDQGYEGLWVFTSPEPVMNLDRWMEALSELAARNPRQAVSLAQASGAFGQLPSVPRGTQPALDEAERAALGREIDRAFILGEQPWPFTDSRRFAIVLPVQ